MDENRTIPGTLKVVAVFFLVGGVLALLEILMSLAYGRISINFGVLGLFIGRGLLAFQPGWRTCALVFLWIALIGLPVFAVFLLGSSGALVFEVFGQKMGHASKGLGLALTVVLLILAFWQYRILTRPDVRRLFIRDTDRLP